MRDVTSQTADHSASGKLRADVAFAPGTIARMRRLACTAKASGCSRKGTALAWTPDPAPNSPSFSDSVMLDRSLPLSEPQIPPPPVWRGQQCLPGRFGYQGGEMGTCGWEAAWKAGP